MTFQIPAEKKVERLWCRKRHSVWNQDEMPNCETNYFGRITFRNEEVLSFPLSLPGFEDTTEYLALRWPATEPLVFLQSVSNPSICLPTLPAVTLVPDYQLTLAESASRLLQAPVGEPVRAGADLLVLCTVTLPSSGTPWANLRAPLVISIPARTGLQVLAGGPWSHRLPFSWEAVRSC